DALPILLPSAQGRVTKPYCVEIESDMKHQHHTHHTRMALPSVTGEPFLTWLDVCSWSQLAKELWPYAVQTAVVVRNKCFNNRTRETPYFMLTGRRPNVSRMQKFGTVCYAYRQDRKKLESRSDKGIFVGYDKNSPAYMVYYPDSRKVMKHRLVRFMSCVEGQQTDDMSDDDSGVQSITTRPNPDKPE